MMSFVHVVVVRLFSRARRGHGQPNKSAELYYVGRSSLLETKIRALTGSIKKFSPV